MKLSNKKRSKPKILTYSVGDFRTLLKPPKLMINDPLINIDNHSRVKQFKKAVSQLERQILELEKINEDVFE